MQNKRTIQFKETEDRSGKFVIEDSTGYLINAAARVFAKALHKRIMEHGVSIGQWPFLMFLWDEDGITQTELSERIKIDTATTVHTIDRMERDKLVMRVRSNKDRRQINIFLTEKAKQMQDLLIPYAVEIIKIPKITKKYLGQKTGL